MPDALAVLHDPEHAKHIAMALAAAARSTDRSTQVGCVIRTADGRIIVGVNHHVAGTDLADPRVHARPHKYRFTEHSERAGIYAAARNGVALLGATMYLPWHPCSDCARAIVESGIAHLICYAPDFDIPTWGDDFRYAVEILEKAPDLIYQVIEPIHPLTL